MTNKLPQREITVKIPELEIEIILEEWEINSANEIREKHWETSQECKTHEATGWTTITIIGKLVK